MAILTHTGLETTPLGVDGLVTILLANWNQLDALFDPATTGTFQNAFWKALVRSATVPTTAARIEWDVTAGKAIMRPGFAALANSASVAIDFRGAYTQRVDIAQDTTFTLTDLGIGRNVDLIVVCDSTLRNLTWPGSIVWLNGTAPSTIAASKTALLRLRATTTGASGLFAEWVVQP